MSKPLEKFEAAVAQVEAAVAAGTSVANACREAGISSQTYYRNRVTSTPELKQRRTKPAKRRSG